MRNLAASLVLLLLLPACGPNIRALRPVMENGAILDRGAEDAVVVARAAGGAERARLDARLDANAAAALANCTPNICEAIARREVVLGMTEAQVLTATGTVAEAWQMRGAGGEMLMVGRADGTQPADANGALALVNFRNGRVSAYTYREPQGLRTIAAPFDATAAGRAAARAEALLQQGDDFAAAGDLALALDRYDRADVIRPGDAATSLRIATVLDKSLRPFEASIRYQMFIHQMELELIDARGDAAAKLADAIARAQQRILVLDRR